MQFDKKKLQKLALKKPELVSALLSIEETQLLIDTIDKQDKDIKELMSLHKEMTGTMLDENKSIQLDALGLKKGEVVDGELLLHFNNKVINLGKVKGTDGVDGSTPTKSELIKLIKPLVPKSKVVKDGITPVKGKDYFTNTDKTEFVDSVKEEIIESLQKTSEFELDIEIVADELEKLEGDKRLSFNSLKDIPDFSAMVNPTVVHNTGVGGQIQIYNDDKILGFTESISFGSGLNAEFNGGILNVTSTGTGGSSTFLELTDTPSEYTGKALSSLRVNESENGLEYYIPQESSTGIISGGLMSVVGGIGAGATVNITAGEGKILNNTDPSNPTLNSIAWGDLTNIALEQTSPNLTHWYFDDNSGVVKQTTVTPTRSDYRTRIYIARTAFNAGAITGFISIANPVQQEASSIRDLAETLGTIRNSGMAPTSSGANLNLKVTAGGLYSYGANYDIDYLDPHVSTFDTFDTGVSDTFFIGLPSGLITTPETLIQADKYAPLGVITTIPGASTRVGIHFVFKFAGNTPYVVVLGNEFYTNTNDAIEALSTINPVSLAPVGFDRAVVLGAVIVQKSEIDLNNATFVITNTFGSFGGAVVNGGGSFLEIANNLSDLQDASIARDNLGLGNVAYTNVDNNFSTNQTINGDLKVNGGLDFEYNANGDGITGTSGAGNQIMSMTRQNGPANASLGISAFGGIGLATSITGGSPETTDFDLFVNTSGNTEVNGNLEVNGNTDVNGNLEVNGDASFTRGTGQAEIELIGFSGGGIVGTDNDFDLLIRRNNVSKVQIRRDNIVMLDDVSINEGLRDGNGTRGTSGQSLVTTGLSTEWGTPRISNAHLDDVYTQLAGQGINDMGMTGFYDRSITTDADLRGSVTVTVTGAGSFDGNVDRLVNARADFAQFINCDETTEADIVIDNGFTVPNFSSAVWQPFFQRRLTSTQYGRFRGISVFVSNDNVTWAQPSGGQWTTTTFQDVPSTPPTMWFGGNSNPSGTNVWRYVKFELRDFTPGTQAGLSDNVTIAQLGIRHYSESYARQFISNREVLDEGFTAKTITMLQGGAPSPDIRTATQWTASGSGTKDGVSFSQNDVLITSVSPLGVSKTTLLLDFSAA